MSEEQIIPTNLNYIHKRLMVLYHLSDMRRVWKKVRADWKKEFHTILPKRFKKYPETFLLLGEWIEGRISQLVLDGKEDIDYVNKSDLKERGWDDKIIKILYPNPDKIVYLGRGRYAYYYNGGRVGELEDSDEFLEHITIKLERKRKRENAKQAKEHKIKTGFGSEFIR
jgi:hypothetical protein